MKGAWAAGLVSFVAVGLATHLVLLWMSPSWATDYQIAQGLKHGGGRNVLAYGKPPRAGSTTVPLANPDMLGTRAYLDLGRGPLVLSGRRPQDCTYWSASVFARNTDVVLVRSDRDTPDGQVSIGLRLPGQALAEPVKDQAILPSSTGVVLLRCFMRDRTDKAYIARLGEELRGLTLRPARGGAQ